MATDRVYVKGERVLVEIIVLDPTDRGNIQCALGAEVILPSQDDLVACEVTRDKAAVVLGVEPQLQAP